GPADPFSGTGGVAKCCGAKQFGFRFCLARAPRERGTNSAGTASRGNVAVLIGRFARQTDRSRRPIANQRLTFRPLAKACVPGVERSEPAELARRTHLGAHGLATRVRSTPATHTFHFSRKTYG